MAALPASPIALPTTYLGHNIPSFCAQTMWYKPSCPRHSTYQACQDTGNLYSYLTIVAKTVEQDIILGAVMKWLNECFEERKARSLALNCTCDDDAPEGSDFRIPLEEMVLNLSYFFFPQTVSVCLQKVNSCILAK